MSRTDISAASLADYLRRKAGDGSIEWCHEPMQASVLLDIADMLDENAKLRELSKILVHCLSDVDGCDTCPVNGNPYDVRGKWSACDELRNLLADVGIEVG